MTAKQPTPPPKRDENWYKNKPFSPTPSKPNETTEEYCKRTKTVVKDAIIVRE